MTQSYCGPPQGWIVNWIGSVHSVFRAPLAPPTAAALEGTAVDEQLLLTGANHWLGRCELLVVESAGGALSPIATQRTVLDLAIDFAYPLLLVVADRVGP